VKTQEGLVTVHISDDGTVRMRAIDGAMVEVKVTKAERSALRLCETFENVTVVLAAICARTAGRRHN
jgi:hypothetical protein